jgi:hypothetical protein
MGLRRKMGLIAFWTSLVYFFGEEVGIVFMGLLLLGLFAWIVTYRICSRAECSPGCGIQAFFMKTEEHHPERCTKGRSHALV